jgi:hypothetical protein
MKEFIGSFKTKQAATLAFAREVKSEGYDSSVSKRIEFNNGQYHLFIIVN